MSRGRFVLVGSAVVLSACAAAGGARAPRAAGLESLASTAESADSAPSAAPSAAPAAPGTRRLAQVERVGVTNAAGSRSEKPAREMLEVEGTLSIVVEQVDRAAQSLRQVVRQHDGILTEDVEDRSGLSSARFTIRIDSSRTDALLAALDRLGHVSSRQVTARDVSKEYQDAEIMLQNLNVTMQRYEQILGRANSVNEILTIEQELTRLRGLIEQVKGSLRWMQDRVSRSTIHVTMSPLQSADPPAIVLPQAKLYPGLRGSYMEDLRGGGVSEGYVGGGLSIRFARSLSFDIEGLRRRGSGWPTEGLDVFMITMGGEGYSEFLGNGRRKFFNPYLGLRLGYARVLGHSEFAAGGTAGIELIKTRYATVDLDVRAYGLFGESSHAVIQPALGINLVF